MSPPPAPPSLPPDRLTTTSPTSTTTVATAAASPSVPPPGPWEFAGGMLVWLTLAMACGWFAWRVAWRRQRLPPARLPPDRHETGMLWAGAAAMVVTQLTVGLFLGSYLRARYGDAPPLDRLLLSLLAGYSGGLGVMIALEFTHGRESLREMNLTRFPTRVDLIRGGTAGLFAGALTTAAAIGTQWMWQAIRFSPDAVHPLLQAMEVGRTSPHVIVLAIFVATVAAPVFEEVLFRGHLQTALSSLMPRFRVAPIVATSSAFAILHPIWSVPPIFVLSLVLGYAYQRTGSLWVSIVIHVIFNTLSTAAFLAFNIE